MYRRRVREIDMRHTGTKLPACFIALGVALATAAPAVSATFVPWKIGGVPAGDLLYVRAFPSSGSKVLVGYTNGTALSMTGKCTGGVDLHEIQNLKNSKQRQMIRYQWCQTWLAPKGNGNFKLGWVYGRYLRPA